LLWKRISNRISYRTIQRSYIIFRYKNSHYLFDQAIITVKAQQSDRWPIKQNGNNVIVSWKVRTLANPNYSTTICFMSIQTVILSRIAASRRNFKYLLRNSLQLPSWTMTNKSLRMISNHSWTQWRCHFRRSVRRFQC